MGLGVRRSRADPRAIALALASLLGATLADVAHLDWLHVPKTGTSFALSQLFYRCEYLDNLFADKKGKLNLVSLKKKKLMPWLSAITNFTVKHLYQNCIHNRGHAPLRQAERFGHKSYGVDQVVTMLRSPLSRHASGFAFSMHGCHVLLGKKLPTMRPNASNSCAGLEQGQSTTQPSAAEEVVMRYVHCVEGCTTSLITGRYCNAASKGSESSKAAIARVELAKAKLDRFAFVGLSERWSQSICVFLKLFPRGSGRPYPSIVFDNIRPSSPAQHACAKSVKKVLERHGYRDEADEAIYAHAVKLFEQTLVARAPECQESSTAPSTTLPPILP